MRNLLPVAAAIAVTQLSACSDSKPPDYSRPTPPSADGFPNPAEVAFPCNVEGMNPGASLGDACREEFIRFLDVLEAHPEQSNEDFLAAVQDLVHPGVTVPISSWRDLEGIASQQLYYPPTLSSHSGNITRATVSRGGSVGPNDSPNISEVQLSGSPYFDFTLRSGEIEFRAPRGSREEELSLVWDPDRRISRVLHKSEGHQIEKGPSGETEVRVLEDLRGIEVVRDGKVVARVDESHPFTLQTYTLFLEALSSMLKPSDEPHALKSFGQSFIPLDSLCSELYPLALAREDEPHGFEDSLLTNIGHPFQYLATRALLDDLYPGVALDCPEGTLTAAELATRIQHLFYLDPKEQRLKLRLGEENRALIHQTQWAAYLLVRLWGPEFIRADQPWEDAEGQMWTPSSFMAQFRSDFEDMRDVGFELVQEEYDARHQSGMPADLFMHGWIAVAEYAAQREDPDYLAEVKAEVLALCRDVASEETPDWTLLSHLTQVTGQLAPFWTDAEFAELQPLYDRLLERATYAAVQNSLVALSHRSNPLFAAHTLLGLRGLESAGWISGTKK